jgi:hypothetical protein
MHDLPSIEVSLCEVVPGDSDGDDDGLSVCEMTDVEGRLRFKIGQ